MSLKEYFRRHSICEKLEECPLCNGVLEILQEFQLGDKFAVSMIQDMQKQLVDNSKPQSLPYAYCVPTPRPSYWGISSSALPDFQLVVIHYFFTNNVQVPVTKQLEFDFVSSLINSTIRKHESRN